MGTQCLVLKNKITRLLQQCKSMKELKKIHTLIIKSPLFWKTDHYFLISRLLFFCAISESGSVSYAASVFQTIQNPNLFVYNTMIRSYASKTMNDDDGTNTHRSLFLYKQMLCNGISADCITFPFLLKECVRRQDYGTGRSIHSQIVRNGFHFDVFVGNSLISLYSACGDVECARKMFEKMSVKDIVSWNSMVIGCLRCGELDMALVLFRKMSEKNVITWNSIITGFIQGGRPKEALEFFQEMQISNDDTVSPDKFTVASTLSACASLGALDHGKWVHNYLVRSGLECDMVISTALIDMYGKCGSVRRAFGVFKEMPNKDVLAWTAMISVFAYHGYSVEAFHLFRRMVAVGVNPNSVTFVGLLSACAHTGLVERARWLFKIMRSVYLIKPQLQHYACMVDVLGRAGLFNDAEEIIRDMPMEADMFVWGALLGGCLVHGNTALGEKVANCLINMQPQNHAFYVTLCDLYAKNDRFDDVKNTRTIMLERGIKKEVPGSSMIEVNGVVHEFSVRGSSEFLMQQLKSILYSLSDEMKLKNDCNQF
ncbi:pentatricopeptide repeat-containing protein At5g66520-like [Apium graveolens]|uniref:pentatricopeptide repeat-containing protein At5g66520-like n=1 Tax=Apium graveolens TaxID=4045 RepID=UPI003D7B1233